MNADNKGVNNILFAALETLVILTIHKDVNFSEFISQFSNAVIDNPRLIAPVAALVNSEQQDLATEKAKMKDRCRQLVVVETKTDRRPVLEPPEGRTRPPSIMSDDKKRPLTYSLQHS